MLLPNMLKFGPEIVRLSSVHFRVLSGPRKVWWFCFLFSWRQKAALGSFKALWNVAFLAWFCWLYVVVCGSEVGWFASPGHFCIRMPNIFVLLVRICVSQVCSVLKFSLVTSCLPTSWKHSLQPVVLQRTSRSFLLMWTENLCSSNKKIQVHRWNCAICGLLLLASVLEQICSQYLTIAVLRNIQLGYRTTCRRKPWDLHSSHQHWNIQQTTICSDTISNGVQWPPHRPNTWFWANM